LEPLFSPDAESVLNELEKDPANDDFVDAIWDVIDFVASEPGSKFARRRALRTVKGHSVWLIPVQMKYHDEQWIVLWQAREASALIAYIGPDDFRA
jgi:hypothetical protein